MLGHPNIQIYIPADDQHVIARLKKTLHEGQTRLEKPIWLDPKVIQSSRKFENMNSFAFAKKEKNPPQLVILNKEKFKKIPILNLNNN